MKPMLICVRVRVEINTNNLKQNYVEILKKEFLYLNFFFKLVWHKK